MNDTKNSDDLRTLLSLLRTSSTCYITTLMPDGSPQLTQTWVDTDGEHILINSVAGYQKLAVAVSEPGRPSRYVTARGRVTATRTDGAAEHIEALAHKYLGGPYPWYGGRDQQRVILVITVDKLHAMGQ